jgi:ATP-dependent DNA helicase RecG
MNSFAHRLWNSGQNNEVAIYKDRIEIYNPGTFPEDVSPEDFINKGAKPIQRNPLLAQTMYYPRYIERFGTGLKRIHDACVEAGVEYKFECSKLGFSVVFCRPKDLKLDPVTGQVLQNGSTTSEVVEEVVEVVENVVESLTPAESEAYHLLKENPAYTTTEIGEKLGITQQAASKRLSSLQAKNVIKRKGSDAKGFWEIVE